jgi:hypothetical protein
MNKDIKDRIKKLFNSTPDDVGVAYGKKMKGGIPTGETSIIFTVEKKKPLSELSKEEVLPKSVTIKGKKYVTDVIEIGKIKLLACDNSVKTNCVDPWYNYSDSRYPYHMDNWDLCRPLKGGVQFTSDNKVGSVGTLGMIAVDVSTDSLVGVTNNHVVIGNAFFTSERPINTLENESDDVAYQEYIDVGTDIGKVVRYVPISRAPGVNQVDGALVSIDSGVVDIAESYKQFGLSYTLPMEFASTVEIDDLISSNPPLCSSGRTTGAKEGSPCGLSIYGIGYMTGVGPYWNGYYETVATFEELLIFTRINTECPWPIYAGDSGSVLIANYSGTWKIIGLCFAGGEFYGLACRIDEVASQLGISAWDGTAKGYINLLSQDIITVAGTSSDATISCNGKTYWQIGAGLTNNPCVI